MTGPGTLALSSAVVNLTSAFSNAVTALTFSSATVNGPGTLTNAPSKTLNLTNSTVNAPLVNQGTLVAQGTSSKITGSLSNVPGSTLRVEGSQAGEAVLTVVNGFSNAGAIELTSSVNPSRAATLTVSSGTLTNAAGASLSALAGTGGSRTLNAQLDNQGALLVYANLTVGDASRTFNNSNSGTIDIASGRITLSTAAVFSSAGRVTIGAGSTFSASGTYTQTAGTLTGAGTLTVARLLTWSGGTMSGRGETRANGGLALSGTADKFLTQRIFYNGPYFPSFNAPTATWTDTGNFVIGSGATFTNYGTFDIQNDAVFGYGSGAAPTFNNYGTLRKSAGTGTTTFGGSVKFTNSSSYGTVEVRTGTLFLQGPFTNFDDRTLTGGTYLISGTLKFASADIGINAATIVLDGPASRIVSHTDTNGLANFATNAGSFTIRNGRNFATATAVAFTNTGTLSVDAGSTFTVAGTFTNFADRTLTGGTYMVSGTLKFSGADVATNAATIVLDGAASLIVNQTDGNGLANFATNAAAGRFTIQNGRTFTTAAALALTNAGTLTVGTASTFTVAGNLTNAATLTMATGSSFTVVGNFTNAGTLTMTGSPTGSGSTFLAGNFTNAGTLTIGTGSTFTVTGTFTNFADRTLTGGTYVVGGTLKFKGADIATNAATVVFDGPASQIVNETDGDGLATFAANAAAGRFAIQNGRTFTTAAAVAFTNAGTLTVGTASSFTASSFTVADNLTNAGTLTVGARSTFTVAGNLTNFVGTTLTGGAYVISGTFKFSDADIATNAATIVLDGTTSQIVNQSNVNALANFTTNTAAGSFTIKNGRNFNAAGPFSNAGTVIIDTDFYYGSSSTFSASGTYTQTAGTLTGAGTLTVAGLLTWSGGTMSGRGETRANGGLALSGAADKFLTQQRTFTNAGTATWTDTGNFVIASGAACNNNGTFDIQNDAVFGYGSGTATFSNRGTLRKSAGAGTTTFGGSVSFSNHGTVEVRTGTLFLQGPFTNFDDRTLTGGTYLISGTLKFASADIGINAAAIVLDGPASKIVSHSDADGLANFATNAAGGRFTIQNGRNFTTAGDFTNAGTVVVSTATTLTAPGRYTQTAGNTTLNGGTLSAGSGTSTGTVDIQKGALAGSGTINANVANAGQVNPGGTGAPGVLTVKGNYSQSATGTLNIEIGGLGSGTQYDQLVVSGTVTLGGTLSVRLINGFVPNLGDSFQVLLFGSRSGDFASPFDLVLDSNWLVRRTFDGSSMTLVARRRA